MDKKTSKLSLIAYAIPILIAFVIILDFSLPGNVYIDDVVKIERKLQRYYNAGGNSHNSYKIVTSDHKFTAEESFAKEAINKEISYSVSLIFNEVNWHRIVSEGKNNMHSFRLASGLIFPLIVIIVICISFKYNTNWNTLLFVLQFFLLADLFLLTQ